MYLIEGQRAAQKAKILDTKPNDLGSTLTPNSPKRREPAPAFCLLTSTRRPQHAHTQTSRLICFYFLCLGVSPARIWHHVHAAFTEAKRKHWKPWIWSYKRLWTTVWVLETKPRASAKATRVLIGWAISLAPCWQVLCLCSQERLGRHFLFL